MKSTRHTAIVCLAIVMIGCTTGDTSAPEPPADGSKYAIGQVWTYWTRPGEEDSRLTIIGIDEDPRVGKMIHVALDNLKMRNPAEPGKLYDGMSFLPFSESAIDLSVRELSGRAEIRASIPEYEGWKRHFAAGRAGVYSSPVADVLNNFEGGLASPDDRR